MEKSNRVELIKLRFGKTYIQCNKFETDDRRLFCNIVDNLVKAVREFESYKFESPIISIAFSNKYEEEMLRLEESEKSLIERKMIEK